MKAVKKLLKNMMDFFVIEEYSFSEEKNNSKNYPEVSEKEKTNKLIKMYAVMR